MVYIISIIISSFLLAILTNTVRVIYLKNTHYIKTTIYKIILPLKGNNSKDIVFRKKEINWKEALIKINKELGECFYLNSFIKWKRWLYIFSYSYLFFMSTYNIQIENRYFVIFSLMICMVALVSVGDFIHNVKETGFANCILYTMKWGIFIIYPFALLVVFLENLGRIDVLLITVIVLLVYSFLFVKSIIDSFSSYLFQFLNFVVILVFFNLYIIGLTFGAFYYENNDTYQFFSTEEINKLLEDDALFDSNDITVITIKGIEPFFNFPNIPYLENELLNYIPIIEHLIGNIYLLLIIGFFVSYSVGVLIERRKRNI